MLLNFDIQFLDLYGRPLEEKMADVLARVFAESNTGDPEKMYDWAVSLANAGSIDITPEDAETLISYIKRSPQLTNLAKGQLLEHIRKTHPETGCTHNEVSKNTKEITEEVIKNLRNEIIRLW